MQSQKIGSMEFVALCDQIVTTVYRTVCWTVYWQKICPVTKVCYGRLGNDTIVSCEGKIQVGVSILPLICWQGQGNRNKRSACWDPKARNCHSKRLTQPLWTYKYVCTAIVIAVFAIIIIITVVTMLINGTTPNSPPLPKINNWTMNHAGLMVVTISLLLPIETPCSYFLFFLVPFFPITLICTYKDSFASIFYLFYSLFPFPITPICNSVHPPLSSSPLLTFVINWSDQHINHWFLISRWVYIYQTTSSPSYKLETEVYYLLLF